MANPDRLLLESSTTDGYLLEDSSGVILTEVPRAYRVAVMADSPVAYWRLGEAPGATIAVEENGSFNGTYVGSPTLAVQGLLTGDSNTAVNFNGTSQFINVASAAPMSSGNNAWSLEGWVKTSTSAAFAAVVGYGTQSGAGDVNMALNSGGLYFLSHSGTVAYGGSYADGATHHLVITWDGAWMTGYADAVQLGVALPGDRNVIHPPGNTDGLQIAVWSNFITGVLDEVAVYNYALTSVQVAAHYAAASFDGRIPFYNPMPPLIAQ